MTKILYYVVTPQLDDIDGVKESNGWKTIDVYSIANDKPSRFADIECALSEKSTDAIQEYLNNNAYDGEYKFVQL